MSAADGGIPASGSPVTLTSARWVVRSWMLSGWSQGRDRMVVFWIEGMVFATILTSAVGRKVGNTDMDSGTVLIGVDTRNGPNRCELCRFFLSTMTHHCSMDIIRSDHVGGRTAKKHCSAWGADNIDGSSRLGQEDTPIESKKITGV